MVINSIMTILGKNPCNLDKLACLASPFWKKIHAFNFIFSIILKLGGKSPGKSLNMYKMATGGKVWEFWKIELIKKVNVFENFGPK